MNDVREAIVSELYEMYQAGIDHNQVPSKYGPVTEDDKQEATDRILALIADAMLSDEVYRVMADGVDRLLPEAERDMRAALQAAGITGTEQEGGEGE